MAGTGEDRGADMGQATHTYGVFLNMLKILIGVSVLALMILIFVYII